MLLFSVSTSYWDDIKISCFLSKLHVKNTTTRRRYSKKGKEVSWKKLEDGKKEWKKESKEWEEKQVPKHHGTIWWWWTRRTTEITMNNWCPWTWWKHLFNQNKQMIPQYNIWFCLFFYLLHITFCFYVSSLQFILYSFFSSFFNHHHNLSSSLQVKANLVHHHHMTWNDLVIIK